MSKYQLVTEASLGRVLGKYFEIGFIIVSAERSCDSEKGRECTDEEQLDQEKQNKQNERRIRGDIQDEGFGFVPAYGGFRELVVDPDTGEERFQDNPNPEASFVIPLKPGKSVSELKELGIKLSKNYNQDSFLFKPPVSGDNKAYFINQDGDIEMSFGNVTVADMTQVYYTYLRKSAPNRRFSMTEPETDPTPGPEGDTGTNLQEHFAMYIPKSPKTFGDAKRRMGEIFIRVRKSSLIEKKDNSGQR
jgi:hypothetical protein|tara:strand:- start:6077 stop:6817 length:741 start_codon:yes stop_codon:yes gene_type:complete